MGPSSWPAGVHETLRVAARTRASQARDNAYDAQVFRDVLDRVSQGPSVRRDLAAEAMVRALVGGGVDWEGFWGGNPRRSSRGSKAKMAKWDSHISPEEIGSGDDHGVGEEADTEVVPMSCDCDYLKSDDDAKAEADASCASQFGSDSTASALTCKAAGSPFAPSCSCKYSCNVTNCACWEQKYKDKETGLGAAACSLGGRYEFNGDVRCEEWGTGCKCEIGCDSTGSGDGRTVTEYPPACTDDEMKEIEDEADEKQKLEGECGGEDEAFVGPLAPLIVAPSLVAPGVLLGLGLLGFGAIGYGIYEGWDDWPEGPEEDGDTAPDYDCGMYYDECYALYNPRRGPTWPDIDTAVRAIAGPNVRPNWEATPICESDEDAGTGHYNVRTRRGFLGSVLCCPCCENNARTVKCWESYT